MSFLTLDKSTQKVTVHGLAQPDADLVKINVEHLPLSREKATTLVIKVPGYDYRSGIMPGDKNRAPAEFQVYRVLEQTDEGDKTSFKADELITYPVRQPRS